MSNPDMGKDISDENIKRISNVLQQMKLSGKEIGKMAEKKEDVESVILWFLASKRLVQEFEPNDRVQNIYNCVNQVRLKLNNLRTNPTNHPMIHKLLPLMQKMVKMMLKIDGADENNKAEKVVLGLAWIVFQMIGLGNYEDAISIAADGIKLMKIFKSNPNQYRVVAGLYHNTAVAHAKLNNCAEPARFYAKAIPAWEEATDIDEDERSRLIEIDKNFLKLGFKELKRSEQEQLEKEFPIISEIISEEAKEKTTERGGKF